MRRYKSEVSFERRLAEANLIIKKYPDRIPVICEKNDYKNTASENIELDKRKYLVPNNLTLGQFQFVVRKRMKLSPEKGLFFFINNVVPNATAPISELYNLFHEDDNFLYITYSSENVFG